MTLFPKRKETGAQREFDHFRQMLENSASSFGDTVAVKYKNKSALHDVTYNELLSKVISLGAGLREIPGEHKRIALCSAGGFPFILSLLTALCTEGAVILLDPAQTLEEQVDLLTECSCDTLFFDKSFLDIVKAQKSALPQIDSFICLGLKEHEEEGNLYSAAALMEHGQNMFDEENERIDRQLRQEEDLCLIFPSKDRPQGYCFDQAAVKSAICGFLKMTHPDGRVLLCLPLCDQFEMICGLLSSLCAGVTVCLSSGPKSFQRDLLDYAPESLFTTNKTAERVKNKTIKALEAQGRADYFNTLVKTSGAMRKIGIDKRRTLFDKFLALFGSKLTKIFVYDEKINPEIVRFYDHIGISLYLCRTLPECLGAAAIDLDLESGEVFIGTPLPGVQFMQEEVNEDGNCALLISGTALCKPIAGADSTVMQDDEATEEQPALFRRTGLYGTAAQKTVIFSDDMTAQNGADEKINSNEQEN